MIIVVVVVVIVVVVVFVAVVAVVAVIVVVVMVVVLHYDNNKNFCFKCCFKWVLIGSRRGLLEQADRILRRKGLMSQSSVCPRILQLYVRHTDVGGGGRGMARF